MFVYWQIVWLQCFFHHCDVNGLRRIEVVVGDVGCVPGRLEGARVRLVPIVGVRVGRRRRMCVGLGRLVM